MNPDFRDILSEFSAAGVEFLVVGAFAYAAYVEPRATGDIDLWVRCTAGLSRRGGAWKITHQHTSVPFLMDGSFKAAVDLKP